MYGSARNTGGDDSQHSTKESTRSQRTALNRQAVNRLHKELFKSFLRYIRTFDKTLASKDALEQEKHSENAIDPNQAEPQAEQELKLPSLEHLQTIPPLHDMFRDYGFGHDIQNIVNSYSSEITDFFSKLIQENKFYDVVTYYEIIMAHADDSHTAAYFNALSNTDPEFYGQKLSKIFSREFDDSPFYLHTPAFLRWLSFFVLALFLGFMIYLLFFRDSSSGGSSLSSMLQPKFNPVDKSNLPTVKFSDVIGNEEAKEDLVDIVEYLKNPHLFDELKIKTPKGVLMVGPPGCGKTLLARAVAGEAGVNFITTSGSEFEEVFVGMGSRKIRRLFKRAKSLAPCIIFIDEIDAMAAPREAAFSGHYMSLNQLLTELDGFTTRDKVIVIGATNVSPNLLEPALLRPGRFDRKVYLNLPIQSERKQLFQYYLSKHKFTPDVSVQLLAEQTTQMSGAEISSVVTWAAIEAIKRQKETIDMDLLEESLLNTLLGKEKKSMVLTPQEKERTAFHEAGHALVSVYTDGSSTLRKATIVPRGLTLGVVNYLEGEESSITRKEMIAKLKTSMGGRVSEEIIFGKDEVSSGASNDFSQATNLASAMVTRFGLNDKIGHFTVIDDRASDHTVKLAQEEISKLIEICYQDTRQLLESKKNELILLAKALIKYETLDKEEIEKVIKGIPLIERDELELKLKKEREALSLQKIKEENSLSHKVEVAKRMLNE